MMKKTKHRNKIRMSGSDADVKDMCSCAVPYVCGTYVVSLYICSIRLYEK